jgi:hypothetical protein
VHGEGIAQTTNWILRAAKAVVVRKSVDRKVVRVQVPPSAPNFSDSDEREIEHLILASSLAFFARHFTPYRAQRLHARAHGLQVTVRAIESLSGFCP